MWTLFLLSHVQLGKIHKTARRRDYHLLIMIITTVVCYLLCWTPYSVVAIMATFGRPGIITPIVSVVPSLLAKSSTVINPIIYIFMNKQVRNFNHMKHTLGNVSKSTYTLQCRLHIIFMT